MFNVVSCPRLKTWDVVIIYYWLNFFNLVSYVSFSLFDEMFIFNEQLRSQYSYDDTMKNGVLKLVLFLHADTLHDALLVYWFYNSNRIWKTIWNYVTSQTNSNHQQRILWEESAPMQVLTTRTWERLTVLSLSFQVNFPFLNHSRSGKTFGDEIINLQKYNNLLTGKLFFYS